MAKSNKTPINECIDLEEYLKVRATQKWKSNHNGRTLWEAYQQLVLNLIPIQENVTAGAMADGINQYSENCKKEIEAIKSSEKDVDKNMYEFFSSEHIIFLNDHGPDHIKKVIERVSAILKTNSQELHEFEAFILLCAIQIHDIGNVLGRAGHEKKLNDIFDKQSENIIIDAPEKRVIKSIAMAHGGKNRDGSKDTLSRLPVVETMFEVNIRTRFLAALLRFADELADDSTRANRVAMNLGIVGIDSILYHDYSGALHTVGIHKDMSNEDHRIDLVYELETSILTKEYVVGESKKYLLDEIYDRTLKMEQERRYCMKFMHPYIHLGRINVTINIYDSELQPLRPITYRLEDILYPDTPRIGHIKDIDTAIPSGMEMIGEISKLGGVEA